MDLVNPLREARKVASSLSPAVLTAAQVIRKHALVNVALVGTTVLSGAFVAGNDAGRAYNSFPLMGDQWIPDEILDMNPLWRNFFENTATVQFDHRTLAITTLTSIAVMFARARKASQGLLWENAPRFTRAAITGTMHMSVVQVGLGITTLLLYVPIDLAVAHQVRTSSRMRCALLIFGFDPALSGWFLDSPHSSDYCCAFITLCLSRCTSVKPCYYWSCSCRWCAENYSQVNDNPTRNYRLFTKSNDFRH